MAELMTADRRRLQASRPSIAIECDQSRAGWRVNAQHLRPDLIECLGARAKFLLRVIVADAGAPDDEQLPAISGEYEVMGGEVHFLPDFPFEPGVRYRAILDLGAFGQPGPAEVLTQEFSFVTKAPVTEPVVSQVFPSGDVLPENLLRFYIRFSEPMRRGCAEANIKILGPDDTPAADVLYRAPVELWDPGMTCLTILLDPGRLKHGVGPNRMLGPPLKVGEQYTLAVDPAMTDTHGRPLREGFRKSFIVSDAIRERIAIEAWKIVPPAEDSRDPLEVTFPAPLDWAQLWHGITVALENGEQIKGRIEVDQTEMRWRFTPSAPWRKGSHRIHISPGLEDTCGNTPYGAFDGPFRSAHDVILETAIRSIHFEVKGNHDFR